MLPQFRERYPTGSLIGELITIHDGSYVVRAIVEVEGKVVATGLAAANTVEEAEDRARIRALGLLGLSPGTLESNPSSIAQDPVVSFPTPLTTPLTASVDISQLPSTPPSARESQQKEADRSPAAEDISMDIEKSIEPTDNVEWLMNKTTVEIQRLGWSATEGRHYLERTYEKRSRQHLTREELVEFLTYLKSQPTP
ncbi:hypothetical protein IQ235_17125 [Oscillatoriales cyanobacterium LEGE 11467]|uniref:Uncharacterized protein n=1 Tax=Zarconia navalis LEGE 11467 TaxID=1828826 RepID=A0A928W1Y2_9CYAN|nr:hypothetical protein [Zarconia navalis LEGE 11467]